MAKGIAQDYFQNKKFLARVVGTAAGATTFELAPPEAGFNSVTTPEISVDAVEYKEGIWKYTQKFLGNPTFSDITFSRGIVLGDTRFYDWIQAAISGGQSYMQDIAIDHYHVAQKEWGLENATNFGVGARRYIIYNAKPIRVKIAADLDATAGDISLQEMDVSYDYFELEAKSASDLGL